MKRFRVALLDTPVIVFNQDLALRYTWIYNSQGYADQPILGKTDAELFSAEDAMRLTTLKQRVLSAGLLTREEVSMTVGERTLYYDMSLDPLYDENGAVIGLTCAATNIPTETEGESLRRIWQRGGCPPDLPKFAANRPRGVGDRMHEAMQLTGGEVARSSLDKDGWLRLTHRAGSPI